MLEGPDLPQPDPAQQEAQQANTEEDAGVCCPKKIKKVVEIGNVSDGKDSGAYIRIY